MKKKSALLALLLAGIMSFGVVGTAACKKKEATNTGGNGTITIPDDDTPKGESPDDPNPVDPNPVDPDPVDPDPVDPNPDNPDPVDPNPVDPAKTYTVTFMDGGVVVSAETVEEGKKVTPPSRTKQGHYLKGWYENSEGSGNAFDFDAAINGNKTLYASWAAVDARVTYNQAQFESAAFEWGEGDIAGAKVEYKLSGESAYTQVDSQLIRQISGGTARVDIVGLKGGEKYDFKITPSSGNAIDLTNMAISAYDRSGYAHFNYSDGVGAYNDDGTLKENAIVLYVTDENKNTVSLSYGGVTETGIGNILNSVGQDIGNGKTSNGGTKPNGNKGLIKKLAEANIPLVVRFIGCVSDSGLYKKATFAASSTPKIDGLTIYDSTAHGGSEGDNGHMARIKSGKDITLEGIGEDAVTDGWGFHYMAESSSPNLGKSFEVRNLTFINTPEDAIGMEGVQASKNTSSDLSASVERCWIHNNEFYGPDISSPAESDKSEGDGSCDFKRGQYLTCSYNYFEGCHKTNLVGSADYSLQYNLTYHHNYWKLCKARGPLARNANIHMYNNVFEGQTDFAMNTRANAYIFSEYNLFYMCKNPQAVEGGAIKSFNDSISSFIQNKGSLGTVVKDKKQTVSNNCQFSARKIDYSKFDTNADQSYIPDGNYQLQTNVTEARKVIAVQTGVMKRARTSAVTLSELSYLPSGVTPQNITTYPSTVNPGKISKTVYAFKLDRSAAVNVSCTGESVLVNEAGECMLSGNGSAILEPGVYMVQSVNFQPGDAKALTYGTFKDITINSISFEEYSSEEFNAKMAAKVIELIDAIPATVSESDGAKITAAREAYNALTAEQKALVTNVSKLTEAETAFSNVAVTSINGKIAALPTVSTADEATMRSQLAKFNEVKSLYEAIPAEKKGQVSGYDRVTSGIATLTEALKPYDVKAAIAALPAAADITSADSATVKAVREAYGALTEAQKTIVGDVTKLTEAEAALDKIAKATVKCTFLNGQPSDSRFSHAGSKHGAKNTAFTVNAYGGELASGLKMESGTEVQFTLTAKSTVTFYFDAAGKKSNIVGAEGTTSLTSKAVNGDNVISVTLEAGTYKLTKGDSVNLYFATIVAA